MLCKSEIFVFLSGGSAFPARCCGFAPGRVHWEDYPYSLGGMGNAGVRQLPKDEGIWGAALSLC